MDLIDFSCKHDIMLEDEQGLRVPMDEPYFRSLKIAGGTWQILSDGDYSYLLEGDDEAILIDSGYGAGNIRQYCRSLTLKPLRRIINTHDHFDHTANNCYFECAYMTAQTKPLATIPFPSFEGIDFPRDYPVEIVADGDLVPLTGRDLLVIEIPDHAVGSIALLDKKKRILFSGDELGMIHGKPLNDSVENWLKLMEKLTAYRGYYDQIFGGPGEGDVDIVEKYRQNCCHILEGNEGTPAEPIEFPDTLTIDEQGRQVWRRRLPHPGDGPKDINSGLEYRRIMDYGGCKIIYDKRRLFDTGKTK